MELVNRDYVRLYRNEVHERIAEAEDNEELSFFGNLLDAMGEYAQEVYIRLDNQSFAELGFSLEGEQIEITRETVLKAFVNASYAGNLEMVEKLRELLPDERLYPRWIEKDVLDYILDNSMDLNEYFDGEKNRSVYNEGRLEWDKVYNGSKYERKQENAKVYTFTPSDSK